MAAFAWTECGKEGSIIISNENDFLKWAVKVVINIEIAKPRLIKVYKTADKICE